MSVSIAPLPTNLGSTRVQKSASDLKDPPSLRARTISPIGPSPMPLIASRPKRTPPFSTVKPLSLLFTSGPCTSTPMRLHSAMALAIFLASAASVVIVDDHAIGLIQPFFQAWVEIGHFLALMLGIDEVGDTIHRAGTVKRNHSHHVLDTCWLELLDIFAHLRALKLEDTRCLTARH